MSRDIISIFMEEEAVTDVIFTIQFENKRDFRRKVSK